MFDISEIFVRKATTDEELQKVFNIRWLGYKNYFNSLQEMIDEFDFAPNVTLLLATDDQEQVLGTMRILDQRHGKIELEKFLNIRSLLPETEIPCAEATRFSIPNNPRSPEIKLTLWKAFYRYCTLHEIKSALVSVRPGAVHDYTRLLFEDTGTCGIYTHELLGSIVHYTFKLNIPQAMEKYKACYHPLYEFFFVMEHPNIQLNKGE
jgi:hypothetical protein